MEMYTWPDSSVKVLFSHEELKKHGIDLYENSIHDQKAETFFTSILKTISHHYNMASDVQIDAEINESEDFTIYMVVRFYDELGKQAEIVPSKACFGNTLFRFARVEDLFAAADRCRNHQLEGGTLIKWDPCYYVAFHPGEIENEQLLSALLEEYGERACINMKILKKKGHILQARNALETLAARQI